MSKSPNSDSTLSLLSIPSTSIPVSPEDLPDQLYHLNFDSCSYFTFNYEGPVKIVDIYDGDTCTIIFPYLGQLCKYRTRLIGIDCPELHPRKTDVAPVEGERDEIPKQIGAGFLSRNYFLALVLDRPVEEIKPDISRAEIRELLGNHKALNWCKVESFGKYGRLLVTLRQGNQSDSPRINELLVNNGYAKSYMI